MTGDEDKTVPMKLRSRLKQIGQNLTGYWVYRRFHLPRGTDLVWDIQRHWGRDGIRNVLDIGANVGQFSGPFHEAFPTAVFHCFEPVAATFARLSRRFQYTSKVHCHNLGLGSREDEARIFVNPDDTESSLVTHYGAYREETVKLSTVDAFCQHQGLDRVDFVKIDTEGFELEVLKGATSMLADRRIHLLLVETELIPSKRNFVPLLELHGLVAPFGYELCGIYNQQHQWDGRRSLYFVNALFASKELVAP
jgi:FkbM family methyltransferase